MGDLLYFRGWFYPLWPVGGSINFRKFLKVSFYNSLYYFRVSYNSVYGCFFQEHGRGYLWALIWVAFTIFDLTPNDKTTIYCHKYLNLKSLVTWYNVSIRKINVWVNWENRGFTMLLMIMRKPRQVSNPSQLIYDWKRWESKLLSK